MAERTMEEMEQLLNNALAENTELQGKLDVAAATNANLRERLELAQKGLKLANLDSLPKSVMEDARRRMGMGLPEAAAIQKALEQYDHDNKQTKLAARAKSSPTASTDATAETILEALAEEKPDYAALRADMHEQTVEALVKVIEGLAKDKIAIEIKKGEKNKANIAEAIIQAVIADKK